MTLAKALANGLPIGCLLVADEAAGAFAPRRPRLDLRRQPGRLRRRRRGCDALTDDLLLDVQTTGALLADGLRALPAVQEVRGAGLLLGAVLDRPAAP